MSWVHEDTRTILQKLATSVLKIGEVPKHVALIMDGNRRYAKEKGMSTRQGHQKGYIKMDEVFCWCSSLGVKEVTIYAFSIENFKRSPLEVANIMKFILSRMTQMLEKVDQAVADSTCIQFPGDWNMVPKYMKPTMAKLMISTRHGTRFKINIALAYTGRNDISRGVEGIRAGIAAHTILPEDMSEYLMQESWQLVPSLPVDILLRTSGETRLSDFLMWEASYALLHFIDVLWPAVSFWDIWWAILKYQGHRKAVANPPAERNGSEVSIIRVEKFLTNTRAKLWEDLGEHAKRSVEVKELLPK